MPDTITVAVGQSASVQLGGAGDVAPYSFMIESGALPSGLSLSSTGLITGTPVALGSFTTNIRVTGASTPSNAAILNARILTTNVVALPNVSIAVAPASVSEDGATNLVYTVTRSAASTSPLVVNLSTSGTATSGTDYGAGVTTVTIPANAATATITIDPTIDGLVEPNETVILTVATGAAYTVGAPASATGTILNDDVPTASIAVAPTSVTEDGTTNLVYTVTLNQAPLSATSVNFALAGSAISGADYAAVASPLVIAAGATTGTIVINPAADVTIEADETAIVTLGAGTGYTVGAPASATGTILNDDLPTMTINDVTIAESDSGTTNATFTVSLSAPAGPAGVTFDISTANGTAAGGADYVTRALAAQTIAAGNSTYSFTVLVNGDTLSEPNETFFVNATNVVNAIVGDGQGLGTITNDDSQPALSIDDVTVVEGNAGTVNAIFTVSLSAASGQNVSVSYASANGAATQPADYISATGTLTFTPGQTSLPIIVPVVGEAVPESSETFFVNLSGALNATILDTQGLGTITNDDVPVTVSPGALPNGGVGTAYGQTITASGGLAPYGFAVSGGALPPGLMLDSGGVLSGMPTAGGTFNFTVTATDGSAFPGPFGGSQAYTIIIAAPTLSLPATSLAGGTLGTGYSANIAPASGGTAPYVYAITAGALPAGLTLNAASGAITGTSSALGTFNFSVTATDSSAGSGPYTATQSYSISVTDQVPVASSSSFTIAYGAPATNISLSLSGGTATSVAIASSPSHGAVVASGTSITYQPSAGYAGSDSFTYTASNSGGTSPAATVTIDVEDPVITITAAAALNTSVGTSYSQRFMFNGGAQPWSAYQVTNLPAGLSITGSTTNTVTISGTATQAGTFNLNVSATDSSSGSGPFNVGQLFALTVGPPALTLSPAAGTLNVPYAAPFAQNFAASGGTGSFSYTLTGALPAGLTFSGSTLSGTPTAPGSYPVTITATDAGSTGAGAPFSIAQNYTLDVPGPTVSVAPVSIPAASAGIAYSQALSGSGGAGPYSLALTSGTLPGGFSFSGNTLAGTPTEVGSFSFTITATDSFGQSGTRTYSLAVGVPALALSPASSTTNAAFNSPISQDYVASGGVGPYSYAVTAGLLPAGTLLNASTGRLSGSTVQVGTFNFTVTATDTGITGVGAPFTASGNYAITVAPPTVTIDQSSLPDAAVASAYGTTLTASGAIAPFSFAVTAGALPAGLNLSSGGLLSGTPTQGGNFNFTVTASDSSGAPGPYSATQSYSLTVAVPTIILPPTSLVSGNVAQPYSASLQAASGGIAPYSYALASGTLPAGLALSPNGAISGTPSAFGSFNFTVAATDSSTGSGPYAATQSYTLAIVDQVPVAGPVSVSRPYGSGNAAVPLNLSGGAASSLAIGTGPANGSVTVNGLTISYQPEASFAGTDSFTYTATNAGGTSSPGTVTITIGAPTLTIAAANPLTATVGQAYSQTFSFAGGTGPFGSYDVTGLPAGLSLTGSSGNDVTIAGSPSANGTFALTVSGRDASTGSGPFSVSQTFSLTVAGPNLVLAPSGGSLTAPYAIPYSLGFTASGGVGPYNYALTGNLPTGVTLDTATGDLSGTPAASGNFTFTITATDTGATGSGAPFTVAGNYTIAVAAPAITVTPTVLPEAIAGQNYAAVLTASGGVGPYSYTATGGTLPAGIMLAANGRLSGVSAESGAFAFVVQVRDANGQSGTANRTLNVGAPTLTLTPATLPIAVQGIAYSQTLTAGGGIAPYSFAVTRGTLPAGLVLDTGTGVISGTPTASGTADFAITVSDSTGGSPATLTVNFALQVTARPDPALDPEVRGLVQAQVAATRRFADAQVDNFMQRMESMHGESETNGSGDGPAISLRNNIRFSTPDYCRDAITMTTSAVCQNRSRPTGIVPLNDWRADANSSEDGNTVNAGPAGGGSVGPTTIWASGAVRFGERDANTGRISQEFESEGITIGADYRFNPSFAAGIGIGLGRDTVDVGDEGSRSKGEAKTVALYASHQFGKGFFIDGLAGYQLLDFDLRRYVTLTGALVDSSRSGHQWFGTLTAGADIGRGTWQLTPYARLDITRARLNGYSENHGSVFDLAFLDQKVDFTSIGAGARFKYRHKATWGELLPQLRAEYQWNVERSADARVAYTDQLSGPFANISQPGIGREELTLGGKLEMLFDPAWALALEYIGRISSGAGSDNMIQMAVKHEF